MLQHSDLRLCLSFASGDTNLTNTPRRERQRQVAGASADGWKRATWRWQDRERNRLRRLCRREPGPYANPSCEHAAQRSVTAKEFRRVSTVCGVPSEPFSRVSDLSSGERQRLLLAAASLSHIPLMLFDTPTAHLDVDGRAICIDLFDRLVAEGQCIVATTLDPELVVQTNSDVYRLISGSFEPI